MKISLSTLALLSSLSLGLSACGSITTRIKEVVVTAIPSDVEKCERLGFVATHSEPTSKTDGLDQLRAQTVQKGGNTVLVRSYATSGNGMAYACDPPVNPEGRYVRQL